MVKVLNADEVTQKVNQEQEDKQKAENNVENLVTSLVQHINKQWLEAKDAKLIIEQEMLWSIYQRRGQYNPTKLAQIKAVKQPEIFMNITETKCRNGVAQIKDVISQPGKRIFSVTPTPLPELPPDVTQKIQAGVLQMYVQMAVQQAMQSGQRVGSAELRQIIIAKSEEIKEQVHKEVVKTAKKMSAEIEDKIDEDFIQGGFYEAIDKVIDDIVGLKCGIIKGPVFRKERIKTTASDPQTGKLSRQITEKIIPEYERRSPFFIYPSPRSTGINDGYLFDVIPLKPKHLHDLIGVEGYKEEEIRAVLDEFRSGSIKNDWLELSPEAKEGFGEEDQRKVSTYYPYENIWCLELWDEISGKDLLDWGMSPEEITDSEDEYSVCLWKIGNHIIKAMLNYDQLGRKPYGMTSFMKQNDSFWGRGIPEMIEDCQQVCNACARAILSNVGIACLTGDTIVLREGQDRKYAAVTIQELFDKKSKPHCGVHRVRLRSLNEDTGEFIKNKVIDVIDNGVRDIYEIITEHGYRIKATGNHRFMDESGAWCVIDDFDIGNLIAVNGQKKQPKGTCLDCGKPIKVKSVRCLNCHNQKQIETARLNTDCNATTARGRFDCKSQRKDFCEVCGVRKEDTKQLEVHHKDKVPWNNKPENLQTLCYLCHPKLHAYQDSIGDSYLHKYVTYDTILSIEYIGKERVYDLCMEAPYHNFIANGFISHNSGPMLDMNIDRMEPGASRDIWPWRVFPTTDEQMGSGSKAINFYQPNMVTEKLMEVYQTFSRIADDHSGVPAFAHGDARVGGAGNTASGLHQLREMAAQGIKAVIRNIDSDLIIPCLEFHYDYLLDNHDIFGLVGDYKMIPEGSSALAAKEQAIMRKNEFLQATANPVDIQIIGIENRRKMLFEVAKDLGIDIEESPFPPPPPPQQQPPQEKPRQLDDAGNPTQGTDNRVFNPSRPRQEVSASGRSGGAGNTLPMRAEGTPPGEEEKPGKPIVVGEEGPEVFVPNQAGKVIPNPNTVPYTTERQHSELLRPDGTVKGEGYFGKLYGTGTNKGKYSTELTIGVGIDGKETYIPSLVPTLSQEEVDHLMAGNKPTPEIVDKAVAHAKKRMEQGLSPYVDDPPLKQKGTMNKISEYVTSKLKPIIPTGVEAKKSIPPEEAAYYQRAAKYGLTPEEVQEFSKPEYGIDAIYRDQMGIAAEQKKFELMKAMKGNK